MVPQGSSSARPRSKSATSPGHPDHGAEGERPFADIRRSLHDVLHILSLHRWAFFIPFSVATCAVFILSLYYPRTYRASTSFERRDDPLMMNLPISTAAATFQYFRNTMVRDLTSQECVEEAVDDLGLIPAHERDLDGNLADAGRERRRNLSRSLAPAISVTTEAPSEHLDVIRVTYSGPDPAIGARLVDAVKQAYIRRTMQWIHEFLAGQQEYFRREADEALADVKRIQRNETRLRLENPFVDPANPGTVALKLTQLDMERRELELRRRECATEVAMLEQLAATSVPLGSDALDGAPTGSPADATVAHQAHVLRLREQIRDVERQMEELKATRGMTDWHPEIQALRLKHAALAGALQETRSRQGQWSVTNQPLDTPPTDSVQPEGAYVATPPAGLYSAASGEQARLTAQLAMQKSKLKDLDISLDTNALATQQLQRAKQELFAKQDEFSEIARTAAQARQRYDQLQTTLSSIEPAMKAIEQGRLLQFSEGQPARGSRVPVSPRAASIALLALLAGLGSGVIFVILAEVFDHVYRSSGQVARSLGLPLLESIDEIITAQDRRSVFLKRMVLTPAVVGCFAGLAVLFGAMAYLSLEEPSAYHKIRRIPQAAIRLFADLSDTSV